MGGGAGAIRRAYSPHSYGEKVYPSKDQRNLQVESSLADYKFCGTGPDQGIIRGIKEDTHKSLYVP